MQTVFFVLLLKYWSQLPVKSKYTLKLGRRHSRNVTGISPKTFVAFLCIHTLGNSFLVDPGSRVAQSFRCLNVLCREPWSWVFRTMYWLLLGGHSWKPGSPGVVSYPGGMFVKPSCKTPWYISKISNWILYTWFPSERVPEDDPRSGRPHTKTNVHEIHDIIANGQYNKHPSWDWREHSEE